MDRRIRKTQHAIKQALIAQLKTQPLAKIRVATIIAQADISRSTFYLHYDDIYDCYNQIVSETIATLLQELTQTYPADSTASFSELATACIHYVVAHRELFELITQSSDHQTIDRLKAKLVEKVLAFEHLDRQNPQDYYDVVCSVNGIIGVLTDWLTHGRISQSELTTVVTNIIERI